MGKQDNLPNATESKSILEASNSVHAAIFLLSVSLLGLRRGHKVSVLLANTPAQGGADTRMFVMDVAVLHMPRQKPCC